MSNKDHQIPHALQGREMGFLGRAGRVQVQFELEVGAARATAVAGWQVT
jgi:hypothetical protein